MTVVSGADADASRSLGPHAGRQPQQDRQPEQRRQRQRADGLDGAGGGLAPLRDPDGDRHEPDDQHRNPRMRQRQDEPRGHRDRGEPERPRRLVTKPPLLRNIPRAHLHGV
jgi:hypothetical protein